MSELAVTYGVGPAALTPQEREHAARVELVLRRRAHDRAQAEASGERARAEAEASWEASGRELRVLDLTRTPWSAVVGCISIWQDAEALRHTLPSWTPSLDALVIADGSWVDGGQGPSTDGLDAVLADCPVPVHRVPWNGEQWPDQPAKRTALLQHAASLYPGALLLKIDADEELVDGAALANAPDADVLWVILDNPALYQRPSRQPRGLRARPDLAVRGRHHWLYAGENLLATDQYGGPGYEHRTLDIRVRNHRMRWQSDRRRLLKREIGQAQAAKERLQIGHAPQSDRVNHGREALRILQVTPYDAGMAGYRLHTALNVATPHWSAFATMDHPNAFQSPAQYALPRDGYTVEALADQADVLHVHVHYAPLGLLGLERHRRLVIHHHGTVFRRHAALCNAVDRDRAGLRLVSNLELLQYADTQAVHWLPNPVPVARYQRLRAEARRTDRVFRIAHSPTKRHLKGTDVFLAVCERLQRQGLPVEPVLIEGRTHRESLTIKAGCDAVFDAFFLGIQCSGIEGAAMGLPVIAGDMDCQREYRALMGEVPYTWANDAHGLAEAIERLVTEADWRAEEARRVHAYAIAYHDEPSVALRYLDLLDTAFQWREAMAIPFRGAA